MGTAARNLTMSPADLLTYQNDLVRTGKGLPLGRMRTIAVGDCDTYSPPPGDPYINGYGDQPQRNKRGRMIDLSGQWLPIAQGPDKAMILITAPLRDKNGRVALPDLADPTWRASNWTEDEVTGAVERDPRKDSVRMIPQRLEDRTNDVLEGHPSILVFQPVLRITYQPELVDKDKGHGFQPAEWKITFGPDFSGRHCAFTCDLNTGECHFVGGLPTFGGDTRG
jgi:hypothetical protein